MDIDIPSANNMASSSLTSKDRPSYETYGSEETLSISHDSFPLLPEDVPKYEQEEESLPSVGPSMDTDKNNCSNTAPSGTFSSLLSGTTHHLMMMMTPYGAGMDSEKESPGVPLDAFKSYEYKMLKSRGLQSGSNLISSCLPRSFQLSYSPSYHGVIEIKVDNLTATFVGKNKSQMELGTVKSSLPWKPYRRFNYYEVKIEATSSKSQIYIGLCDNNSYIWNKNPGTYPNSYAYRSDDGKKIYDRGISEPYGPAFSYGDIVGCGIDNTNGTLFFTLNGKSLGTAFRNVSGNFCPIVSLHCTNETIKANFGAQPFVFDIDAYEVAELHETLQEIRKEEVNSSDLNSLIYQYLAFQGYHGTLQSLGFNASNPTRLRDPKWNILISTLEARSRIRSYLMEGNIKLAYDIVSSLFPKSSSIPKQILFPMKCQEWIELIRAQPDVQDIINFLQKELGLLKSFDLDPIESEFLEKCTALIAYENPHRCIYKWLFDEAQRERVADIVNATIVLLLLSRQTTLSQYVRQSNLELLLKHLCLCLQNMGGGLAQKKTTSTKSSTTTPIELDLHGTTATSTSTTTEPPPLLGSNTMMTTHKSGGMTEVRSGETSYYFEGYEPFVRILLSL